MENGKQETQDLTFVPTMKLCDELKKRHDALVIAGVRFTDVQGSYKLLRIHHGHRFVCLSQLSNMESIINAIENASLNKSDD